MKDRLTIILAILTGAIFSASCSQTVPEATVPQPTQILEIRIDAGGMVDVFGSSIHFRVLDDGNADFEFPDPTKTTGDAKEVNIGRTTKLSPHEVTDLIALLRAINSSELQQTYQRKCCCHDTYIELNIKIDIDGQRKETLMSGLCSEEDMLDAKAYDPEMPSTILHLYEFANSMRDKYKSR